MQKNDSFTTLIPPPLYDEGKKKSRNVRVYVTEINADFCTNDSTPLTIQDPV